MSAGLQGVAQEPVPACVLELGLFLKAQVLVECFPAQQSCFLVATEFPQSSVFSPW